MATHQHPRRPGTPCWADVVVRDLRRSQQFYSSLLGWEFTKGRVEHGSYVNALLDGRTVAGMSEGANLPEDQPVVWVTYLASDDVSVTAKNAHEAGGSVLVDAMDVAPFGKIAVLADPGGAAFGVWQAEEHAGFQVSEVPGSVTWADSMSSHMDAAKTFYTELFGYEYVSSGMDGTRYDLLCLDDEIVGGIGEYDPTQGVVAAMWSVTFGVRDVDASAALVEKLGGSLLDGPMHFAFGRMALAAGPDGEMFCLHQQDNADGF